MNASGAELIESLVDRLKKQGKTCHDYQILFLLSTLTRQELNQLVTFGTLDTWMREPNNMKPKDQNDGRQGII